MKTKFDIDKFVKYLEKYKSELPTLYKWECKIDRLIELEVLTEYQIKERKSLSEYHKELQLKKIVGQKLKFASISNIDLFENLCLWVIKDWGGIKSAKDNDTIRLIYEFLNTDNPKFNRIASSSKVGAFLHPEKNVIYDSRVAYSINWIILSENAGQHYFPIPEGRNSKMMAFDLYVLIRLKNIWAYQTTDLKDLNDRYFINNSDKKIFIRKNEAYSELNNLIKLINQKLWKGDPEKQQNLYYTEMLLYSIADKEIFMDIIKEYGKN